MVVMVGLLIGFAAVLLFYGLFRTELLSIPAVSVLVGFFWILSGTIMLAPFLAYLAYKYGLHL